MPGRRDWDAMLDAYGRVLRALMVLHHEAETDLDFDAYVELANVRYDETLSRLSRREAEVEVPKRVCPEANCVAEYLPEGAPYRFGVDDRGREVWMQRWMCGGRPRHWHTEEVAP